MSVLGVSDCYRVRPFPYLVHPPECGTRTHTFNHVGETSSKILIHTHGDCCIVKDLHTGTLQEYVCVVLCKCSYKCFDMHTHSVTFRHLRGLPTLHLHRCARRRLDVSRLRPLETRGNVRALTKTHFLSLNVSVYISS